MTVVPKNERPVDETSIEMTTPPSVGANEVAAPVAAIGSAAPGRDLAADGAEGSTDVHPVRSSDRASARTVSFEAGPNAVSTAPVV